MSITLKHRRGNTLSHSTFTGALAEITVDTDKNTVVVHNNSSAGGFPLARESAVTTVGLYANSSYIHANAAFDKANTSSKSTASSTAPVSPSIGDLWYDTDTDVLLRYTNDGTSNNWVDITGPTIGRSTYIRPTYLITANAS